jgi:putative hydrolase of the HAD superfamily
VEEKRRILAIGTGDTKADELLFMRERIEAVGGVAVMMDVSVLGDPLHEPEALSAFIEEMRSSVPAQCRTARDSRAHQRRRLQRQGAGYLRPLGRRGHRSARPEASCMSGSLPKALVLDFGGVVTRTLFETHPLTEQVPGLKPGTLNWRGPFDPASDALWRSMQADEISERDYWKTRTREVGKMVGEDWQDMSTFVQRARGADPQAVVRPETGRAIRIAHEAGVRLAILSSELDLFYGESFRERLPLLLLFEVIVDATYTKILKPDSRAYAMVGEALQLPLSSCVFVDDPKRNVEDASARHAHRSFRRRPTGAKLCRGAQSFRPDALLIGKPESLPMRDINFLTENNAKPIRHPMAHPAEMRATPPKIIMKGEGVSVTDAEGRTVLDAVGGLWNVNLGYSCDPIKKAMAAVADGAYEAGVMLRVSGNNIILSPPLIITAVDVAKIAEGLDAGLAAAAA